MVHSHVRTLNYWTLKFSKCTGWTISAMFRRLSKDKSQAEYFKISLLCYIENNFSFRLHCARKICL